MARIRMVKPEFFDDPDMGEVSPLARLLFIGLWTQSDKEGRLEADLRRLKARLFPYDAVDIEKLADELVGKDMIRRYAQNGHSFIWIRNFVKHQRPHPKEPESLIPIWTEQNAIKHGESWKKTADPSESGVLILDPLTGSSLSESETRNLDSGTRKLELAAKNTASPVNGNGHVNGRSRRPVFQGQRFVVFDWMLEDMSRTLGSQTDAFDLHEWFFQIDAKAVKEAGVIAKQDQWPWLQRALMAEVDRRGLPISAPVAFDQRTRDNIAAAKRFAARKTSAK